MEPNITVDVAVHVVRPGEKRRRQRLAPIRMAPAPPAQPEPDPKENMAAKPKYRFEFPSRTTIPGEEITDIYTPV